MHEQERPRVHGDDRRARTLVVPYQLDGVAPYSNVSGETTHCGRHHSHKGVGAQGRSRLCGTRIRVE